MGGYADNRVLCRLLVNDENLGAFLKIREKGFSVEYVKVLEQLCIRKSDRCSTYAFLLEARDKEIEMYKEAKSQRDALRGMWLEQNEQIRDLMIALESGQAGCYKCRLKKLCMKIKRIKLNNLASLL